jgi:hypothetical protein
MIKDCRKKKVIEIKILEKESLKLEDSYF